MKKKLSFIMFFILLVMAIVKLITNGTRGNQYKDYKIADYNLKSNTFTNSVSTNYKLLVADSPEKWERGLMFFRKLDGVDGMIFIFPDKSYRTFWNKNTLMDLKLLWIDNDNIVGESFLPSIEKSKKVVIVNSPKPANKVIEFPADD